MSTATIITPKQSKGFVTTLCFDMDGVLYDSMPYHASSWAETSDRFGLGMTEEDVYLHEGRTGFSTIDIFTRKQWGRPTNQEEVDRIYAVKCDLFNALPEAKPMLGALNLLRQVQRDGFQIVLVTGSAQYSLLERLNRDFPGIFRADLMVTGSDVVYGKPNPEPYLMAMHKAGVKPEQTMVVENAPLGVRSAVDAGAYTVACNTGPLADQVLLDEGAQLVLPSLHALSDYWPTLRDQLA